MAKFLYFRAKFTYWIFQGVFWRITFFIRYASKKQCDPHHHTALVSILSYFIDSVYNMIFTSKILSVSEIAILP